MTTEQEYAPEIAEWNESAARNRGGGAELWAVHTTGMDDLHACASRRLAVRNATWLNLGLANSHGQLDEEAYPLAYNVPVRWPYSVDDHQRSLDQENAEDARWSDLSADVIAELARHMYGDA